MTEKTDAEFIAECEAAMGDGSMNWIGMKREALIEAIERLKRANQYDRDLAINGAIGVRIEKAES